jgi:ribosomal protein L30E
MIEDFKKLVKEGKVFIGTQETVKHLKRGEVSKVFVSSNCPDSVRDDIKTYAQSDKVDVEELKVPNEELGVLCKKQFSISVIGVKKVKK